MKNLRNWLMVGTLALVAALAIPASAQRGWDWQDRDHDQDDRNSGRDRDRDRDNRGNYGNSKAYQQGYREGMNDRQHNRQARNRRWNNPNDQNAYAAGYRDGYNAAYSQGPYNSPWGNGSHNGPWGNRGTWGYGQASNGYGRPQILRAWWGAGSQSWDVTSRVQSLVNSGVTNIVANNKAMGGDPAPNQYKTLTVVYSNGRGQRQVRIPENQSLNLP